MMKPVVVVGGGPAGSTTAILLAEQGLPVLLLDRARFPRPKPCGECLNPGAIRQLRALGLDEAVLALDPGRMQGWSLQLGSRRYPAVFPEGEVAWGLDRIRLDSLLLERARETGVEIREGWRVTGVATEPALGVVCRSPAGSEEGVGDRREGGVERAVERERAVQNETLEAAFVVGADGLRSTVAASLGLRSARAGKASTTLHLTDVELDPSMGHLHLGPGPTVGVAPLCGDGSLWTLTVVHDGPLAKSGAAGAAREDGLLALARSAFPKLASARVASDGWSSGSFHVSVDRPWADGVLLVGDAAGYYDPLTGQGIYRALCMAQWGAQAVVSSLEGDEAAARARYRKALAGFSTGRRLQSVIEWARQHPAILRGALGGLATMGGLDPLIAITGDLRSPNPSRSRQHVHHR